MTEISKMTLEQVREYAKKTDSEILLADLEDIMQFDIGNLPVGYLFPRHYIAIKNELARRLHEMDRGK